jgi:dipeptide/tripeptide permease
MVNIGSFLGPYLAGWVRERVNRGEMRLEEVFRIAAVSVFLMLIAVLIFFKEPRRAADQPVPSLGQVARNFFTVLSNGRFVLFLLIFSGYWIVFWQQYLILPAYIHNYVDPAANTEWILITDPLIVIFFTVAINALTRGIPSFPAITLGTLVTALGWLALPFWPSKWAAVVALAIVATGEIIQSPRYYEYISRLAPPGQQGTYMGFAFLPIGIGSLVGGWFAGKLLHHYGEVVHQPQRIWWIVTAVGLVTALALWIYDRLLMRSGPLPATTPGVP